MLQKHCFVYLCYDFPIIGILCITRVVLYICVLLSLLLVFYVSQALFCISVLWFPYNWYFIIHKRWFVYLCYDFPIIDILCFTSIVLYICVMISLLLVFYVSSVVLYICVMNSLLLVFYVSQALFCISVFCFPYYWYFMFHKRCFVYLCSAFPIIGIFVSQALFCISVIWFPYNWYFMFHKVVLYICVLLSL